MGYEGSDWMQLAQDRVHWRLDEKSINIQIP